MRNVLNTIENVATAFRLVVGLAVTGVIVFYSFSMAYAPQIADDDFSEFDEQIERARANAQSATIDRDLADDGWGSAPPASYEGRSRSANGEMVGGWGEDTR